MRYRLETGQPGFYLHKYNLFVVFSFPLLLLYHTYDERLDVCHAAITYFHIIFVEYFMIF